ncbi:MAG: C25 family cysteine peptidase, partial [Bryobacteraceae bacterium]
KDIAQSGWGIIFANNADPAIREALKPLLELRRAQASKVKESRYREFSGPDGFWSPDETKPDFLDRHGAGGGGAVDPDQLPYYLLIAGSPEAIPYSFQYQLDVQYAVGRLHFDNVEDYARYAQSVVEAERGNLALAKRAAFFGVANPDDAATTMSSADLVAPLAQWAAGDQPSWKIVSTQRTTKAGLAELLGGSQTPALLFTASHGMSFKAGDERQPASQGALLCGDWPGPEEWRKAIPADFYFGGGDLAADARLHGMISFHFACFGAGTPQEDDFVAAGADKPKTIAPSAFVGNLPQRMLSHPRGGALAVIGHIDRAWGYSFRSKRDTQLRVFQSTLKRLMEGHPVGSALEYFNNRYAELSSDLVTMLRAMKLGKAGDEYALASAWTCNNDARNYVVLGDPAVRLPLEERP